MPPLILVENQRKTKKLQKKEVIRSRRKTMLKIIKTISTEGAEGTGRKYVVMFRYGNEAHTFTQVVSETYLLEKDPELLIELLANSKRASSS